MRNHILFLVVGLSVLAGCASPEGKTVAEKTAYTLKVRDEALAQLAVRDPSAQAKIKSSAGYLFMSGFSVHPLFGTFANAYGVLQDNKTGKLTYMRLGRFGLGPGLAVKGYYLVATLPTAEAVTMVAEGKWAFGALAEASFHFGSTGGSAVAETAGGLADQWLWTHDGVSLELAGVLGKVYPEDELNGK